MPGHMKSVITRDHVVAISKGGRNDITNLRPLCYSCNSKKGDREPIYRSANRSPN